MTNPRPAQQTRMVLAGAGLVVLVLAGIAALLRIQQELTGNLWGVPLDDAYIHFQFARNVAGGHGFSFNPNQPVPGSTSPLWVFLLAAGALAGLPLWLVAKVYGVLSLILAAIFAWRLAAQFIDMPVASWAVGALTALDGRLLWAAPSGMEVTMFTALSLATFLARPPVDASARTVQWRIILVALLCGLATLARPEGYLLSVVLAIDLYRRHRPSIGATVLALALYLLLVLPYPLFCLATTGHPLPTTFYAKASSLGAATLPGAMIYLLVLIILLLQSNFVLIVAPLGALALWRQGSLARAVILWPLLLVLEQAFLSPVFYHFQRYIMPLDPFFALWLVMGLGRFTSSSIQRDWRASLPALAAVVVVALSLGGWATTYALSVQNINDMHVRLGQWVRHHVAAGVPVAMHDVGAITYISGHPAVDIEGLISPEFIAIKHEQPASRRARDILAAVKRQGARYLIVFPSVYAVLVSEPGLRRVYSVTLSRPVIVPPTSRTMAVYEIGR